jgi:hypothetical protein
MLYQYGGIVSWILVEYHRGATQDTEMEKSVAIDGALDMGILSHLLHVTMIEKQELLTNTSKPL